MNPGIYHGIPAAEYHALPFVSNSYLKRLAKCPAAAKTDTEDTPALAFGRACHVMILEGLDAFHSEFVVLPNEAPRRPSDRLRLAKKPSAETIHACDWWDAFTDRTAGKEIVSMDDYQSIVGMSDSVRNHPFAKLLLADGVSETTVIFDLLVGDQTIRCKVRPDRTPSPEMRCIVDVKTTDDPTYDAFLRTCYKYSYIQQAAFYLDGYNSIRPETQENMDAFVFIAIAKKPPYQCEVYTLVGDNPLLQKGRDQYKEALLVESQCRRQGLWPAYQNAGAQELLSFSERI